MCLSATIFTLAKPTADK